MRGIVHAIGLALLLPMLITLPGPGGGDARQRPVDVEIDPALAGGTQPIVPDAPPTASPVDETAALRGWVRARGRHPECGRQCRSRRRAFRQGRTRRRRQAPSLPRPRQHGKKAKAPAKVAKSAAKPARAAPQQEDQCAGQLAPGRSGPSTARSKAQDFVKRSAQLQHLRPLTSGDRRRWSAGASPRHNRSKAREV